MKKMIIAAVLIMISAACFSENLTGFYGIPFGSTIEETTKIMTSKGWTAGETEPDKDMQNDISVEFTNKTGTYAGLKVESVKLSFYKNRMYYAAIFAENGSDGVYVQDVINQILNKYGMTQKSSKDTDGNVFMWTLTDNAGNTVCWYTGINLISFTNKTILNEREKDRNNKVKQITSGDI